MALAPLLVVYLGFGLAPKLVIIALVCFFPITVGAIDGFEGVDPEYRRMMRTLHAGDAAIFRRVEFPAALPSIFSGARVAASYTAIAALFAEFVGSSAGLGFTIREANDQFDTALIGAAVLAACDARADPLLGSWRGAAGGRALVAPAAIVCATYEPFAGESRRG